MSFDIEGKALVLGDAIGNHHVAFRKPDWISGADQDPEQAVATRKMLFDRAVNEQLTLVGFHLPQGGIGRAEADGNSYRFVGGAS